MKITFLGAAGEVTGSCFLVESEKSRFLIDCGMFQGDREAKQRNAKPFPFRPASVDFVLLTHAHIDHSGLLPKLMKGGFSGPIYTTGATADLLGVMLPDSGHIQEAEAARAARRTRDNGHVPPPLYTVQDALRCLEQVERVDYDEWLSPSETIGCRFRDAGHILGSAILEIRLHDGEQKKTLVVSGDLGQPGRPIVRDPTPIEEADYLLVESTYGNRNHKDSQRTLDELVDAVRDTLERKRGNVIIPAFAVGRTQEIIYHLHDLTRQGLLHGLQIFVDSPMATEATRITMRHLDLFDERARALAQWRQRNGGDKAMPQLHFVGSVEESQRLNTVRGGAIILSASGMCDAGRIKHHLRHQLGRSENSVVFTGFQARGTLGRRIVEGAKTVRIFGQEVPVRADVYTLGGFSAHADQDALMGWLGGFQRPARRTFVVHGEQEGAEGLSTRIRRELGWQVELPRNGDHAVLGEK